MYKFVGICLGALAIAGCSDIRHKLGLEAEAPDEFTVYDRAPLTVPPQFALRPPRPGEPRPQEGTITTMAQKVLAQGGAPAPRPTTDTPGKSALLKKAGVDQVDATIRHKVDEDISLAKQSTSPEIVQDVLFWQKKTPPSKVVDPYAEKKRLQQAPGKDAPKEGMKDAPKEETKVSAQNAPVPEATPQPKVSKEVPVAETATTPPPAASGPLEDSFTSSTSTSHNTSSAPVAK